MPPRNKRPVESTYGLSRDQIEIIGMVDECPVPRCEENGSTHEHVRNVIEYYERQAKKANER